MVATETPACVENCGLALHACKLRVVRVQETKYTGHVLTLNLNGTCFLSRRHHITLPAQAPVALSDILNASAAVAVLETLGIGRESSQAQKLAQKQVSPKSSRFNTCQSGLLVMILLFLPSLSITSFHGCSSIVFTPSVCQQET